MQIDQAGRTLGKSNGIQMRAFAFPFNHAGAEMLITAPELNHLRPLTDAIEARIMGSRMASEMLPRTRGRGIARQPHWQARFSNGARIMSRLPNISGKGVKGQHPLVLESDEMQDYPLAGWIELVECLKRGSKGAQWRAHGVSRGVHDKFYEYTQEDSDFTVHKYMAPHRPTWSPEERNEKTKTYGGSRQNSDYKRNIYGEHGDATNPVFVLARLMACVDTDEASEYNTEVYQRIPIDFERLQGTSVSAFLDLPGTHLTGHALAPKGYTAYYGGADIGMTNHPSEFLIFGVRAGTGVHELLLRVHMERVDTDGHMELLDRLFTFYGAKLKGFGLDRTGLGFSIADMGNKAWYADRFHGYNFSENVPVGFREPKDEEDPQDLETLAEMRNVIEHSTDVLRNRWVDPRKAWLPFDRELLAEWQGQNYTIIKSAGSPYGKRDYARGKFHSLDAGKMAAAAETLPPIQEMIDAAKGVSAEPIMDIFVGAM